jgi:predicted nucleic acid-binding protein
VNVLVYSVDADEPTKRSRAVSILAAASASDLVVSSQVLGEFYAVVTRRLARPLGAEGARELVEQLTRLEVVSVDAALVAAAIGGSIEWQLSYWDALIIRAAQASGCDRIWSEDLAHGRAYGDVIVEDPFTS